LTVPLQLDRILIIRLSHVGDVIHTLPLLHALRTTYPNAHISWLGEDLVSPILFHLDELDEPIILPRTRLKRGVLPGAKMLDGLRRRLKSRRFDVAIDAQNLTKSAVWSWLAGCRLRIGFVPPEGRELSPWLNNRLVRPHTDLKHVVDMNMSLLEPLGVSDRSVHFHLPIHDRAKRRMAEWLNEVSPGEPPILLSPGAGWETKRWPAERFGLLADQLAGETGRRVVVIWGPNEKELCDEVLSASRSPSVIAAPPTDLLEMTELVRLSRLLVTNDTGPLHIAVAVQVPTVSIWGPTDPERNGPYGSDHQVVLSDVPCRFCWSTICRAEEEMCCMKGISVEGVLKAALECCS